ncbi:hypothetical protein [Pseudomonas nitroreducens]|uniref:hypothetical protein n=1 Tax=Pseudomonas nitroreducens TaxID=46680 RepID=UPI002D7FFE04|nr:hypothetical protein [Pseudomonas nitroreducens]
MQWVALPRNRWIAFLYHLAISFVLLLIITGVMYFCWFPGALFDAAGGWEGMRILVAVDLVLGPTLTLIVFNRAKPIRELTRDLGTIATVQLLCLLGGVYTIFYSRPIVIVQVFDTFYALNREGMVDAGVNSKDIDGYSGFTPSLVYVPVPQEKMAFLNQYVKGLLNGEKPVQFRTELYRELPRGSALIPMLHTKSQEPCIRVDLESVYRQGHACFDLDSQRFSDFALDR